MCFFDPAVQSKKTQKSKKDRMKEKNAAISLPNTEKKFFSLGWSFSERFEMSGSVIVVCGSGPYVYTRHEGHNPANSALDFGAQLSVFEATGTHVRGVQNLCNGGFVIWGDCYFAYIPLDQLVEGGTVCQSNIISTGRQIVAIRPYRNIGNSSLFEVYYTDGTFHGVESKKTRKRLSIDPKRPIRLPLRKGETVTTVFTKDKKERVYLGTSQGRLIAITGVRLLFITESLINSPVKQIALTLAQERGDITVLLLFENGSIVNFKDKKRFTEIKGRYTRLSDFCFNHFNNKNNINVLAGDMDGNLTAIRTGNWELEVLRTMINVTSNPISMIELLDMNTIHIGSTMGEVHIFDKRTMKSVDNGMAIPTSVRNNVYHYMTSTGWYFLKDNKLWNCAKLGKKNNYKTIEMYSNDKTNLKMKYMNNGPYDREFIAVYGCGDLCVRITDIWAFNSPTNLTLRECPTIMQVIPMEQSFLVQLVTGEVRIYYIDGQTNKISLVYQGNITKDRIMAAASVVRIEKTGIEINPNCIQCCGPSMNQFPFDLLLAHEPGKITVVPVEWNQNRSQKKLPVYTIPVELDGSRVVSMLTSLRHCGAQQCLMLSKKGSLGLVYRCNPKSFPPCAPAHNSRSYSMIARQSLGSIIGNGHSLFDTSLGIFAAGFKQHTLHVCWISMSAEKPPQYSHIFVVDTASSRLPFTIVGGVKQNGGTTSNEIVVSYYQKTGIKEEYFTFYEPKRSQGFKHFGIISDCLVSKGYNTSAEYYYSGDTDGRFSLWGLDDKSMNGQKYVNDFQLNGSVTSIHCIHPYIAVSTSQGTVHFFLKLFDTTIQLIPQFTYNAGKKVTFVTNSDNTNAWSHSFMIFLDDGTVKEYSVDTRKEKTMGNFSISTKMAICQKHKQHQYIVALGVDGILRRTVLKCKGGNVQMSEEIEDNEEKDYTPENRPIVWVCPVPSPRKLIVLDKRRIMVLGKGVATRSF